MQGGRKKGKPSRMACPNQGGKPHKFSSRKRTGGEGARWYKICSWCGTHAPGQGRT